MAISGYNKLMQCPWSGYTRGSTKFCEATLCSWIESPGIAWAGIMYVLVGVYLFRLVEKSDHWLLKLFPWFAISMGVSSFFFHSSHIFIFQAWDVISMFMLGTGIIFLNFRRMLWPSNGLFFLLCLSLESVLFVYIRAWSGPAILGFLILVFILTEISLRNTRTHWRDLKITFGLFAVAVGALWMEHKSGLCNPHNHIFQWHAVWDSLCAFTYLTLFRHFKKVY